MGARFEGLGRVRERRPFELVRTFVAALAVTVTCGAFAMCTPGRISGRRPVIYEVDEHGNPTTLVWVVAACTMAAAVAIAFWFTLAVRRRFRMDVGHDGLSLRRPGEERFVAYSEIAGVGVERGQFTLAMRTHERFHLRIIGIGSLQDARDLRDEIARRMETARAEPHEPAHASGTARMLLARGARSVERWMHDVRALASGSDYRAPVLRADDLWGALEDAGAPSDVRAAAAVALASNVDDRAAERMRAIARACADGALRTVIERAAGGASDGELSAALAAM